MKSFNPRPAFSLLELLVAISVTGVMIILVAGWIHQSLKFASTVRQRQRDHQSMTRLAWELRDDVRGCKSMAMDGNKRLVLHWEDGSRITYAISGPAISVERAGENQGILRETFDLPGTGVAEWETSEMPEWISLVVNRGREGIPAMNPEHREVSIAEADSARIDLHVRISPDRWPEVVHESDPETSIREEIQ